MATHISRACTSPAGTPLKLPFTHLSQKDLSSHTLSVDKILNEHVDKFTQPLRKKKRDSTEKIIYSKNRHWVGRLD